MPIEEDVEDFEEEDISQISHSQENEILSIRKVSQELSKHDKKKNNLKKNLQIRFYHNKKVVDIKTKIYELNQKGDEMMFLDFALEHRQSV